PGEANAGMAYVRARPYVADQLIQGRRAELVHGLRFFERGEQSFVVERGEQYVLVARPCAELGSKLWQPRRDMRGWPGRYPVLWPDVRPLHDRTSSLRRAACPRVLRARRNSRTLPPAPCDRCR